MARNERATDGPVPRRYRIFLSVARGLALMLGTFTLLNVIGGLRNPGFDANLWWIDLRFANPIFSRMVMIGSASGMLVFAIRPRFAPCHGWLFSLVLFFLAMMASINVWTFQALQSSGGIHSKFPIPLSALVLIVLGLISVGIRLRDSASEGNRLDLACLLLTVVTGSVLFPIAQMYCYGLTDYRRPADVIVVFGCKVYSDGAPSMALSDRVKTGIELYHAGLGRRLIFSGGPGPGEIHETEAMRQLALQSGVPESAIEVDRDGLNTQATVRNLVHQEHGNTHPRVLAVSNFYHLPRIKLCFRRAGWEVWTVPARESLPLYYQERFMIREVFALWWYYLNPD